MSGYTTLEVEAGHLEHSFGQWVITTNPGCETEGSQRRDCLLCDHYETATIAPLGHNLGEWYTSTAPTCVNAGQKSRQCANCDHVYTPAEEIPAQGHIDEIVAGKAATCTETGLTEGKKCSVCKETTVAQDPIPKLGHSYSDATCIAKATCSICQDVIGDFAEHVDGDSDGKCDACEHQMTPIVPEETTPEVPDETTPAVLEENNPDQPEEEPKEGLSGGTTAGIVAGSTAVAGVGGFSLFWFVIKKKRFSDLLKIMTGK